MLLESKLKKIKDLTWAGQYQQAIALAKPIYMESDVSRMTYCDVWATILYSARKTIDVTEDFEEVVTRLTGRLSQYAFYVMPEEVDAVDALTTQLLWWVKKERDRVFAQKILGQVEEALYKGINVASPALGEHTLSLMQLTLIQLWLQKKRPSRKDRMRRIQVLIKDVRKRAPHIANANQQMRVYKRLAYVYFWSGRPFKAAEMYIVAREIKGAAPGVRAKLNPW